MHIHSNSHTSSYDFHQAAQVIRGGGVVAYPTEACFGLGCDPRNRRAIARIRELKQRAPEQGFILVSDNLARLLPFIEWQALSHVQRETVLASWPGPITWLIPASPRAGRELTGHHATLAVRVSAFGSVRDLVSAAQTPLVSTSANLKGQAPLTSAKTVARVFGEKIDCIIDLPIEGLDKPSRIIDARTEQTIRPA